MPRPEWGVTHAERDHSSYELLTGQSTLEQAVVPTRVPRWTSSRRPSICPAPRSNSLNYKEELIASIRALEGAADLAGTSA
jgi:hypothetical protein